MELKKSAVTVDGLTTEFEESSGNIYADLGFPNPEEHKMKSLVVIEIIRLMRAKEMTQAQLAKISGIDQPKISKLLRGQFHDISIEKLLRIVNRMGHKVEVRISEETFPSAEARTLVSIKPAPKKKKLVAPRAATVAKPARAKDKVMA